MRIPCRSLVGALLAVAILSGVPVLAAFNDIVQIFCDVDVATSGSCDATADGMKFVSSVAVSPDDEHVYICSSQADSVLPQKESLSAFSRAADGSLTLVDQEVEDSGGVSTLASCRGVAVSPDGNHVYTAALAGLAPTDTAIAVSPDGLFVAVSSPSQAAIATFSRAADGTLRLVESICDDIFVVGSDDIGLVVDLAHSRDGDHLYSAGGAFETLATIDSDCDSPNVDLALSNESVSTTKSETACRSIQASTDYDILAAGNVTMTALRVTFGDDVSVAGILTVSIGVP